MARIQRSSNSTAWIASDTLGERHLLACGLRDGGRIVLEDSYYAVTAQRLLLPEGISQAACERLAHAFERAARSHLEALSHRRTFRVVDE